MPYSGNASSRVKHDPGEARRSARDGRPNQRVEPTAHTRRLTLSVRRPNMTQVASSRCQNTRHGVIFHRGVHSSHVPCNGLRSFQVLSANLRAQRHCHCSEFRKRFVHAGTPILAERGVAVHNRVCARVSGPLPWLCTSGSLVRNRGSSAHAPPVVHARARVTAVREELTMADVLRSTTLPVRTDPLDAPTPQTMVPWPEVLAFLHHLVVYLHPADNYPSLIRRPSQGQKDLYERALMASQRPSPPW